MSGSHKELEARWFEAVEDGERMKDSMWAVGHLRTLYRTLHGETAREYRAEVASWLEASDARQRHDAWILAEELRIHEALPYAKRRIAAVEAALREQDLTCQERRLLETEARNLRQLASGLS